MEDNSTYRIQITGTDLNLDKIVPAELAYSIVVGILIADKPKPKTADDSNPWGVLAQIEHILIHAGKTDEYLDAADAMASALRIASTALANRE